MELFARNVEAEAQIISGIQRKTAIGGLKEMEILFQLLKEPANIEVIRGSLGIVSQQLSHRGPSVLKKEIDAEQVAVLFQIRQQLI